MNAGLDNVIAADTVLSHVDGEAGRLIIRGHDLEDLVARFGFEDAAALLWQDFHKGHDLRAALGAARVEAHRLFSQLSAPWHDMTAVEAMRHGMDPTAACRSVIERLARLRGTKVAASQVALLALDKQGRAGAFALQPGFTYAMTDAGGQTRIVRAAALFETP